MSILDWIPDFFVKIYVKSFKYRERCFDYSIKYHYLPDDFAETYLPIHMDLFWFKNGFTGFNKSLIPKGFLYSARFDQESIWFQSWIGTYFLNMKVDKNFKDETEQVRFLSKAAVEDQNYWMRFYGVQSPRTVLKSGSIVKISQKKATGMKKVIYYGEMQSNIDNSVYAKPENKLIRSLSTRVIEKYNSTEIPANFLSKNYQSSKSKYIDLYGYFSVITINPKKFLITYVCGALRNKESTDRLLLKVVENQTVEV